MESLMLSRRLYRSEVYTNEFKIDGKLEPMGEVVTALSDRRRNCMTVYEATLTPISAHNPLSAVSIPEIVISKRDVAFVALLDPSDYTDIRLLTNVVPLTVYLPAFVLKAEFHMGGEMKTRDFVDAVTADFIPVTNARFFPLVQPKAAIPPSRAFVLLNKNLISAYYGESKPK